MKKEKVAWEKGALLICTKCGKTMDELNLQDPEPAETLKKHLKQEMKNKGLSEKIRVMTSSCLDICIPQAQAVCYVPQGGSGNASGEAWTLHPEEDREALLHFLLDKSK